MEKSGAVTIEGENYEVVDECVEDEDASGKTQQQCVENKEAESKSEGVAPVGNITSDETVKEQEVTASDSTNNVISNGANSDNNTQNDATNAGKQYSGNTQNDSINAGKENSDNNTQNDAINTGKVNSDNNTQQDATNAGKENSDNNTQNDAINTGKVNSDNNTQNNATNAGKENSDNNTQNDAINTGKVNSDNNTQNDATNAGKENSDNNTQNDAINTGKVNSVNNTQNDATNAGNENSDNNTQNDATNAAKENSDNNPQNDATKADKENCDNNTENVATNADSKNSENNTQNDATNANNENSDNNTQNDAANAESTCPPKTGSQPIDFTADIALDQLEEQKDTTDDDVLCNLDAIENIVLNASDFEPRDTIIPKEENVEDEASCIENEDVNMKCIKIEDENDNNETLPLVVNKDSELKVKSEIFVNIDWYEKKLIEKQAIIKERLSKVARVLAISYPRYENWLEHEEQINGSPLCKLKPSRRCSLNKPYTNRWKFICNRKKIYEPTQMVDNCDGSPNRPAEIVWRMEASGAWGVNTNNKTEFPPFVLRAVKIFEDFLQTTEQLNSQNSVNENFSDDVSLDIESKKEESREGRQDWSWLLVRCNSMDELMLFATGKNINRSTMDRLKQVYESGPGKDCNVKSLYCKSTNKYNDTIITDTTFLVGSEALDEVVGGLKVQLAPKTNFWSNAAGAENVANAVIDLLAPTRRLTVLEVGCGIGLIGLMMASKCHRVIGVDSPSEVEEAEMICELNNIKNASFIMGSPAEVTEKIVATVKNRRTCAVINANTNIGRATEIMTCLRKVPSLKRIVMITTLTKQSVRPILELARPPSDPTHGSPFMPVLACAVDTLPIGPHFEVVILLQRRMIHKLIQVRPQKAMEENVKKLENKNTQDKIDDWNTSVIDKKTLPKGTEVQLKRPFKPLVKNSAKKARLSMRRFLYMKKLEATAAAKSKLKGKRPHSPDKGDGSPPNKLMKKFGKYGAKPWNTEPLGKKKKDWNPENTQLRVNSLYEKKMRETKEQTDLRERLSGHRLDTNIAQTVKEHQALLEIAKEKLSGPAPTVDVNTAKQLQSMLNMVLEQTNKLQSQLPRSVWDRIAPPESTSSAQRENKQDDSVLKGRYIQGMGSQDILITAQNKTFLSNEESAAKPAYKKYNNIPPLEPNTIMPESQAINPREERPFRITPERYRETEMRQQQTQETPWNRDRTFERNRWNEMGNIKKQNSPMRIEFRVSPPKRLSPKRPLLSPPRRPCSPPRRHFSPLRRPVSPGYRQRSPIRCQLSPLRRAMSPPRRPLSPRRSSPPQRPEILMNRPLSPMNSIISPSRRQPSPMKRPMSPPRRQMPSPNRLMCPNNNRPDMLLPRRQSMPQERQQTSTTIRRAASPQRFSFERPGSPPRQQQSPQRRQISPQMFGDDWDIPSRGAVEQSTWMRPGERMSEQNIWRTDKSTPSNNSWDQTPSNDKRRKTFNQDNSSRNDSWNKGGNNWNPKQMLAKSMAKETWCSNSDRWSNTSSSMPGSSNNSWNIRGKDSFNSSKESWMDNKKQTRWEPLNVNDSWKHSDKEDLNDLPEDAKDPWGDDGTSDLKERWHKFDGASTSSTRMRDNEQQGDSWGKNNKDSWQNKGSSSFTAKPQWQNNGVQNVESRWLSQNDMEKKTSPGGWQSGNNVRSWQFQNSNFQSQRPFSTNQFKGLY